MMSEQRNQSRQRVFKAGKIVVMQGASVFDCIVRNLSDDGACVDLGTTLGVPDSFVLNIEADRLSRPCHVVWRTERRIGVRFPEPPGSPQP
jgi:hypothetical protein